MDQEKQKADVTEERVALPEEAAEDVEIKKPKLVPKEDLDAAVAKATDLERERDKLIEQNTKMNSQIQSAIGLAEQGFVARFERKVKAVFDAFLAEDARASREVLLAQNAALEQRLSEEGIEFSHREEGEAAFSLLREFQQTQKALLDAEEWARSESGNASRWRNRHEQMSLAVMRILTEAGIPDKRWNLEAPMGMEKLVREGWERKMEDLLLENKALEKDLERTPERGVYKCLRWFLKSYGNKSHDGHDASVKGCMFCAAKAFIKAEPPKEKPKKPVKMYVWNWEAKDGRPGRIGVIDEDRLKAKRAATKKAALLGISLPFDFETALPEEFDIEAGLVFG